MEHITQSMDSTETRFLIGMQRLTDLQVHTTMLRTWTIADNQYAQSIAQKQAQIAAKSQQDADKKRTSAGYTSGDVVQFLASTLKDSSGNTLTKQEKIKYLQDAGVSSAEISAANKYVVKDKKVKDRL